MKQKSWISIVFSFASQCRGKIVLSVLCAIISVVAGLIPYWSCLLYTSPMGKGIKTRVSEKKGIKAIDKAAVASERMKEAYIRTKDKACLLYTSHIKNAGLALTGKEPQESKELSADKGVLAKLRSFVLSCGKVFSEMERDMALTVERINGGRSSVKTELQGLRSAQAGQRRQAASKEQAR